MRSTQAVTNATNIDLIGCVPKRFGHGYYTFEVKDFRTFLDNVAPLFLTANDEFLWRGARNPSWPLSPSLARELNKRKPKKEGEWKKEVATLTTDHAMEMIEQLRGLGLLTGRHDALYRKLSEIAAKPIPSFRTVLNALQSDNEQLLCEMFSTGQHHGLLTPFLDWTRVPAIALFFAFAGPDDSSQPENVGNRVVYALNRTLVVEKCPLGAANNDDDIVFMGSMAHDNPRIIGQQGLFTFIPAHTSVDEWVVDKCSEDERPALIRFLIRNEKRAECLAHLASLNIHERTLFPDRHGAAGRTNDLLRAGMNR